MTNLKTYLRKLMNIMMTSGLIMIYKPLCALVYFRYQEDFKSYWLNWSERCPGRWSPTSYYERRTHRGRSVFSLLMTPCLVSATEVTNTGRQHSKSGQLWDKLLHTCCYMFMTIRASVSEYEEVKCCVNKTGRLLQVKSGGMVHSLDLTELSTTQWDQVG